MHPLLNQTYTKLPNSNFCFSVHGHWYFSRLALMVHFSFYKAVLFTCQLAYAFFSNFSAVSLFDSVFLIFYNTFYTSVPILVAGVLEKRYPEATLLKEPRLYKVNRHGTRMAVLFRWCAFGLWHTFVIFFGSWLLLKDATSPDCSSGICKSTFGAQIGGIVKYFLTLTTQPQ